MKHLHCENHGTIDFLTLIISVWLGSLSHMTTMLFAISHVMRTETKNWITSHHKIMCAPSTFLKNKPKILIEKQKCKATNLLDCSWDQHNAPVQRNPLQQHQHCRTGNHCWSPTAHQTESDHSYMQTSAKNTCTFGCGK